MGVTMCEYLRCTASEEYSKYVVVVGLPSNTSIAVQGGDVCQKMAVALTFGLATQITTSSQGTLYLLISTTCHGKG